MASRSSWTVASPITGDTVALMSPSLFVGCEREFYGGPLSSGLARIYQRRRPRIQRRDAEPVARTGIQVPGLRIPASGGLQIAARGQHVAVVAERVTDPAQALHLAQHLQRLLERS